MTLARILLERVGMGSTIGHIISLTEEKQLTKNIGELNSVENLWLLQSEIPENGSRKNAQERNGDIKCNQAQFLWPHVSVWPESIYFSRWKAVWSHQS